MPMVLMAIVMALLEVEMAFLVVEIKNNNQNKE